MKIEKVNDNQIRCTLTREDLASRELKISELAYGTDKAKNLFREMMEQASFECGFEAEDIPLMIEAIPLNHECIVLIITKVEDPEELDTRFSKFAPSVHDEEDFDFDNTPEPFSDGADEVLNLLRKISDSAEAAANETSPQAATDTDNKANNSPVKSGSSSNPSMPDLLFRFRTVHEVTRLAHILAELYKGDSSLYKDDAKECYLLWLNADDVAKAGFNKIYNICSEYGIAEKTSNATHAYLTEHYEPLIQGNAVTQLALI